VYALVQASDGGYALAGKTSSFGDGNSDVLLAKTGESGNVQWTRTYGGTGVDEAFALVQTADGGYALAGRTWSFGAGLADFWLAKTNASGVIPEPPSPMILAAILVALLVVASSAVILAKRNSKKAPLARIVDSARENRILSSQARAR
jgi:hypothetical protein